MSGLKDAYDYRYRGVYGVYNDAGELMYVGSTSCGLKVLEENHRKAREKGYDMTKFRTLLEEHESWKFVWLVKPHNCQQPHIEFAEQTLIQAMKPKHNVDKTPYKSSIYYDRYADVLQLYGEELEYLND
jgi:hypothetical protein